MTINGPKDAAKLGIEVVYQDLALCDNLDVVQNMYLGREEHDWFWRLKEPPMEQHTAETLKSLAVTTIRSIRQPVASLSGGQRQSVAVAQGRAVELEARDPRRADGRARRRADASGARPRQAPRRAGPRRRAHLAQPARHLRGRDADHRPPARSRRRHLRARRRRRSRRSCRRSPPACRRRSPGSRRPCRSSRRDGRRSRIAAPGIGLRRAETRPEAREGDLAAGARQRQDGQPRRPADRPRPGPHRRLLQLQGDELLHRRQLQQHHHPDGRARPCSRTASSSSSCSARSTSRSAT